jgi:uncharacterized protein YbaA (DUF1428 family)
MYIDGFVIPIPKRNVAAYQRMTHKAGKLWREHGAVAFYECVGDDLALQPGMTLAFPQTVSAKPDETVLFSWIVYKSRKHRDAVNAKVQKDTRLKTLMPKPLFDVKRMAFGGFKMIVEV